MVRPAPNTRSCGATVATMSVRITRTRINSIKVKPAGLDDRRTTLDIRLTYHGSRHRLLDVVAAALVPVRAHREQVEVLPVVAGATIDVVVLPRIDGDLLN